MRILVWVIALFLLAHPGAGQAAETRVGVVLSLTGPDALIGQQIRDGLRLGLKVLDPAAGDPAVEIVVEDDQGDATVAAAGVKKLLEKDPPAFMIGPLTTPMLMAAVKPATDAGTVLFSPATGPAALAGRQCSANTFVTLWQNDQVVEVISRSIEEAGVRRIALVVAEDASDRETAELIKKHIRGEIVSESRVADNTSDFAPIIERIKAAESQSVILALRGAALDLFLRVASVDPGLTRVTFYTFSTPDFSAAKGMPAEPRSVFAASNWASTLDNPENRAFVTAFEGEFGYAPDLYAVSGYDAAQLIVAAIRRVRGNLTDKAALRAAVRQAQIKSPRGSFAFSNNNMPVQDFYLVRHSIGTDEKPQAEIVRQVFSQYGDAFTSECTLR